MTSQKLNSWGPSTSQASADIPTSYKQKTQYCNNSFITGIHLDSLGNYTTTLQLPQLIKTDQQSNSTSISICASSILRYILEGEYDNTHSYILLISSSQVQAWSHVPRVEGHSDSKSVVQGISTETQGLLKFLLISAVVTQHNCPGCSLYQSMIMVSNQCN